MLDLRTICENCGKHLPPPSTEAMICSFECTFCKDCVENILYNVCPNCGGGFEKRPVRPKDSQVKYPPSVTQTFNPVDKEKFSILLQKFKNIPPAER